MTSFQKSNQCENGSCVLTTEQCQCCFLIKSVNSSSETFHRRELKEPSVAFTSPVGRGLFKESMEQGCMECYFPLSEQFTTQSHPAFCGLSSLTMALNALLLDPNRVWKGVWRWFDDNVLGDCCIKQDVIQVKGITLEKLACLARCNGATCDAIFATDSSENDFRNIIRRICTQPELHSVLIVSYSRARLNQTGSGHFSPIGGYHPANDMVLIMDVARFKYPPHWVPLSLLYSSMCEVDEETNRSRGFLIVTHERRNEQK
mmetsp:Transcript_27901/g.28185  ORF Transcript_27901/g.28185 Transcript_27901/m.28185 type:complete len:260 (+) Transcript_27901:198-977(+)